MSDYESWQGDLEAERIYALASDYDVDYHAIWEDDYDYDMCWEDPTWRDKLIANLKWYWHALRYRFDKKYRQSMDDIPF